MSALKSPWLYCSSEHLIQHRVCTYIRMNHVRALKSPGYIPQVVTSDRSVFTCTNAGCCGKLLLLSLLLLLLLLLRLLATLGFDFGTSTAPLLRATIFVTLWTSASTKNIASCMSRIAETTSGLNTGAGTVAR